MFGKISVQVRPEDKVALKVKDLIEALKELPPDASIVVKQEDGWWGARIVPRPNGTVAILKVLT